MQKSVWFSLVFLVLTLTGCGGGGGGGASTVTVSGLASKGPFVSGTVTIYDVSEGIDAKVKIDDDAINSDGRYGITILPRSTPIMIEIAAGSIYQDEAKVGATRELRRTTLDTPLRAILPSVAANATISVTPFTELAVRKAELAGSLSASVINDANALIAQLYNLPNILTTTPVDASSVISSTDANAINYGLALAAISQMAQGSTVEAALNTLRVNGNLLSTESSDAFKNSLSSFLGSVNNLNSTQYPNIAATSFASVGSTTATTAVIEVGLKESKTKVYSLNFRMVVTPETGVVGSPAVIPINEAVGVAGDTISPLFGVFNGVATVFLTKNVSSSPGYNIVANKPVLRMTYTLAGGTIPKFQLNLDPQNNSPIVPLELTDPVDPTKSVAQTLTPEDYYVTVRYQ